MPSQFFGLNIAYTGLLASNAALNTTSNNIANVQTDGYSRQHVVQQASNALRIFQTYGCAGAGVETLAIERIRDDFYDYRFWNNQPKVGEYGAKAYYMQQLESYFEDDGVSGFKSIFDLMMANALQELKKNPGDDTTKSQFIGASSALAEYFNNMAGNMEAMQKDLNQEIKLKVDEVNALASEIATLNKQINVIELSGGTANELRDRRTLLVDQLSEIVDVEAKEYPIVDSNNPDRATGASTFVVKIAGGQTLVNGNSFKGLECVARENYEKVNQTDIDGLYEIRWSDGSSFNLHSVSMSGSLAGLIQMRDGNNGENFTGEVSSIGTTPDGKQDTVTINVSKDSLKDLNKCNLSDKGGIITLGNQDFYYDSWEYSCTYDDNGDPVYSYTFTLSDSTLNERRVTNDRVGKNASVGDSIAYQGIPYYMNQMDEWVRTFAQHVNDILGNGIDGKGNPGNHLFTGNLATSDEQYELEDGTRYDTFTYAVYQARVDELVNNGMSLADAKKQAQMTVKADDDSYYRVTAKNFSVLAAMLDDPALLATKSGESDGESQYDILDDLDDMVKNKKKMSFRGATAGEFLQCILTDVTLNASRANTFYSNYTNIGASIENQRISISGVDEDEEAVNLVKYQNGYNLASKMIQILTEVYDRLILQTGV